MKTAFVDTNLFIRYLTNDDKVKADKVEKLLELASSGKILLVTTEMVIAEIVWVLESGYSMKAKEIAPLIRGILVTKGLEVYNRDYIIRAVELYESTHIDFIDGYIVAVMEKHEISDLFSYDRKHISRIPGILRKEP
ncbi:MAG: PIN domain-containing protein [Candidatus Riflebacteria bacterium]|nr:PIN domain-containing protein [Candidatus Riflebacteria bacterium]